MKKLMKKTGKVTRIVLGIIAVALLGMTICNTIRTFLADGREHSIVYQ